MTKRTIRTVLYILALVFPLTANGGNTVNGVELSHRADSVYAMIPKLNGEEQLKAWKLFIDYDEVFFDSLLAPQMIERYIEACRQQKDTRREAAARMSRQYINYNLDRIDAMSKALSDDSLFLIENGRTDQLFIEWGLFPSVYINLNQIKKAQQTTERLYEEAQRQKNNVGIGMGAFCFGYLYESLGNDSLSTKWYQKSYNMLRGKGDYAAFHYAADKLCESLNSQGRSREVLNIGSEWRMELEKERNNQQGELTNDNYAFYQFEIDTREADAYLTMGQLDRVEQLLNHTTGLHLAMPIGHQTSLYHSFALLYKKKGEWNKAYEYISKCNDSAEGEIGYSQLPRLQLLGECLIHLGRYSEAARILLRCMERADTLRSQMVGQQLSEMQSLYEVQELQATNYLERQRSRFTTGGIVLVLGIVGMLVLIVVNGQWRRRLEVKNLQLLRERNIVMSQNKELAVERDRAETASKAKTAFMQSMTHEIRTPLNAISGFSQMMAMSNLDLPAETRHDISQRIQDNTQQLTNILNDMIQITDLESRTDLPEGEDYPAAVIVAQAADDIRPHVAKDVNLETECLVADDLIICTHPRLLLMALSKLLDNAAKFTKKGHISFTLHTTTDEQGTKLNFSIADTGPGIPEDKKEYIFERFAKLDSFTQGTGLGLSVARMIAERLGGSLTLDTDYRDGSKFDLTIPVISSTSQA